MNNEEIETKETNENAKKDAILYLIFRSGRFSKDRQAVILKTLLTQGAKNRKEMVEMLVSPEWSWIYARPDWINPKVEYGDSICIESKDMLK